MALLLLDSQIPDLSILLRSLKSNVTLVLFDFEKDSFESITEKIPEKSYTHLGMLRPRSESTESYCLLRSFGESVIKDVERLDPALDTWTSFHLLVELCVSRLGVQCLDMLEYLPSKDVDYLSAQWDIPIRYASSPLGNDSLRDLYFMEESYPYTVETPKPRVRYEKQIMRTLLQGAFKTP